ncbi:MAG: arsenic resistance protein, partial [Bacillota bacterium]
MFSKILWGTLGTLQKKLILSIPISMVLGLAFGYFFHVAFLKNLIIPFTFLMVYPMMVTIKMKELVQIGNVKLQISAQVINFLVIPFLGFGIGLVFFKDNPLAITGLLLTSLLPTSGMTISW